MTPQQAIFKKNLKQEPNLSLLPNPKRPSRCAAAAAPATLGAQPSRTENSRALAVRWYKPSRLPSPRPRLNLCCDLPIRGTSGIASRRLPPIHWVRGISFPPAPAKHPSFRQQTWRNGVHDAAWSRRKLYGRSDSCSSSVHQSMERPAVESAPVSVSCFRPEILKKVVSFLFKFICLDAYCLLFVIAFIWVCVCCFIWICRFLIDMDLNRPRSLFSQSQCHFSFFSQRINKFIVGSTLQWYF